MAFWSVFGHQGAVGEFEWVDSMGEAGDTEGFQLIKEGHLTMSTSVGESLSEPSLRGTGGAEGRGEGSGTKETNGVARNAAAQSLRRSNEAFIKGWKRYWCVLSQTNGGQTSLLYYNKQSGFVNCESPNGVLLLTDWKKLYTLPQHSKSRYTFAIEFPYKTVLFYTENESDQEDWLGAFRRGLGLKEESKDLISQSVADGLKGLPKQKAIRRVSFISASTSAPESPGTVPQPVPVGRPRTSGSTSKEIPSLDEEQLQSKATARNVQILSYKVFPTTS